MEQELPERSLLMVRPPEETIHMQIVHEARLMRMMHFLEKLEERGVLNKVEGGDAVSFIAPILLSLEISLQDFLQGGLLKQSFQ